MGFSGIRNQPKNGLFQTIYAKFLTRLAGEFSMWGACTPLRKIIKYARKFWQKIKKTNVPLALKTYFPWHFQNLKPRLVSGPQSITTLQLIWKLPPQKLTYYVCSVVKYEQELRIRTHIEWLCTFSEPQSGLKMENT